MRGGGAQRTAPLGSALSGSALSGSARFGSARLGSVRLGSAPLGPAPLGPPRLGAGIRPVSLTRCERGAGRAAGFPVLPRSAEAVCDVRLRAACPLPAVTRRAAQHRPVEVMHALCS